MKRPDRMKVSRYLVFGLLVFLLFLLGDTPGILPPIAGAVPSLMVSTAVCIALSGVGETGAMLFGMACGLLMDFSRGGPYGFSGAILAVLCYFIGLLVGRLFQKNLLSALFMAMLAVAVVFTLQWVFYYLLPGYSSPLYALMHHYSIMAAYTFGTAIPIYFIFRFVGALFKTK